MKLLKESQGNILDDEVLINTLNNSKVTSNMINVRVREAEETEKSINVAREAYRTVANRGSILYFVMADLALIGPMYQYSLAYIARLFNDCIDNSPKSEVLEERLTHLMDYTTAFLFNNGCRGLFEEHKGLFGFLMASAIYRANGDVSPGDWSFLLRGVPVLPKARTPHPAEGESWLPTVAWDNLCYLDAHSASAKGVAMAVGAEPAAWRKWAESEEPHMEQPPGEWGAQLAPFARLLLLKVRERTPAPFWTLHPPCLVFPSFGPLFAL